MKRDDVKPTGAAQGAKRKTSGATVSIPIRRANGKPLVVQIATNGIIAKELS
jgi:hypothetical protein